LELSLSTSQALPGHTPQVPSVCSSNVPFFHVLLALRLGIDKVRRQWLKRHRHGRVRCNGGGNWLIVTSVQHDGHWWRRVTRLISVSFVVQFSCCRLGARSTADASRALSTVCTHGENQDQQKNDECRSNTYDQDDIHADCRHRVGTTLVLTVETTVALSRGHLQVRKRRRSAEWPLRRPIVSVTATCRWRWTRRALFCGCYLHVWNDSNASGRRRLLLSDNYCSWLFDT